MLSDFLKTIYYLTTPSKFSLKIYPPLQRRGIRVKIFSIKFLSANQKILSAKLSHFVDEEPSDFRSENILI